MVQLTAGFLALLAVLTALANQSVAGTTDARLPATGWELERDVEIPSYAVTEPASTNLNIESVVLLCEQGPHQRGLQLRLYLSSAGPLAPLSAGNLKNTPTVDFTIDDVSYAVHLLFADDFVVVADFTDGLMPILSGALLDELQAGRRMELQFQLLQGTHGQTPAFDGIAVVDLQAGPGGAAVAAVRRCAGASNVGRLRRTNSAT